MRIAVGARPRGFPLKDAVVDELGKLGVEPLDLGAFDTTPGDFPDCCRACGARHTERRSRARYPAVWQRRRCLHRRQQAARHPRRP
jgi:ribose 5-phosphate isomerase RpiB